MTRAAFLVVPALAAYALCFMTGCGGGGDGTPDDGGQSEDGSTVIDLGPEEPITPDVPGAADVRLGIASATGQFPRGTVPSPEAVARGFGAGAPSGRLVGDIVGSLYRGRFGLRRGGAPLPGATFFAGLARQKKQLWSAPALGALSWESLGLLV